MFKAKYLIDGQVYQILDTYYDVQFNKTWFFLWIKDRWRWYSADNFVPPNYEKI